MDDNLTLHFLQLAPHPIHKIATHFFRMVDTQTGEELGKINLRIGSTPHIERYAGHVGYSVHEAHRGHRYAARSVVLLCSYAKAVGFANLWITCDPENIASRRTLELAGAEFIEIVNVPQDCIIFRTGHPWKCRYRLDLNKLQSVTERTREIANSLVEKTQAIPARLPTSPLPLSPPAAGAQKTLSPSPLPSRTRSAPGVVSRQCCEPPTTPAQCPVPPAWW